MKYKDMLNWYLAGHVYILLMKLLLYISIVKYIYINVAVLYVRGCSTNEVKKVEIKMFLQ